MMTAKTTGANLLLRKFESTLYSFPSLRQFKKLNTCADEARDLGRLLRGLRCREHGGRRAAAGKLSLAVGNLHTPGRQGLSSTISSSPASKPACIMMKVLNTMLVVFSMASNSAFANSSSRCEGREWVAR